MSVERVHLYVSGKVQGVGFRFHTRRTALEEGLVGWVKNLPDGRVEIMAEGLTDKLERFLAWCHQGPASSKVERIVVEQRVLVDNFTFTGFQTH